jgi:hypothetical protein
MKHLSLHASNFIWCNSTPANDEYGEFYSSFAYETGKVTLRITADSNYAAYLNGTLCACGQYANYPHGVHIFDDPKEYNPNGTPEESSVAE